MAYIITVSDNGTPADIRTDAPDRDTALFRAAIEYQASTGAALDPGKASRIAVTGIRQDAPEADAGRLPEGPGREPQAGTERDPVAAAAASSDCFDCAVAKMEGRPTEPLATCMACTANYTRPPSNP